MTSTPLMADQTLFRDARIFDFDHLPETFHYRDAQVRDLAFAFRPCLHGSTPLNTILRGVPGTGKTTAVRRIFAEVGEVCETVVPVLVPCQAHCTPYAVFSQIYLALFGQSPPGTGVPLRRVMARIAGDIAARGAVLVVCLDDAGHLLHAGVLDEVLASLLRIHEGYPGARAGVLLTLSDVDLDLSTALTPSTLSVLHASEVFFPPYSRQEIRGILADRVRAGLYPGVVPPAILDLMAERTDACGDLRVGLDMVRRAALAAEMEARTTVTAEDVHAAYAVSRHLQVGAALGSLNEGERAVLDAVLASAEDEAVISAEAYTRLLERRQMSYTAFHDHLRKLEFLRLVDLVKVRRKGRARAVLVRDGVEEVMPVRGAGVAEEERGYGGGR
ncbi:ORC1-type DNA replication protein [Methanofollis fontis]|uniref:ORC1-type DNA replication protein n=1 Tax=Methanofollis fontis TaxID=2052832 RepID=A0A483CXC3_9EURY|nr:ORC1-type DNA replication protein [Methanofollis fontis]TAJ43883.1 orc1/cdc6 family replication initiation protein [Methanofollis fontis]